MNSKKFLRDLSRKESVKGTSDYSGKKKKKSLGNDLQLKELREKLMRKKYSDSADCVNLVLFVLLLVFIYTGLAVFSFWVE